MILKNPGLPILSSIIFPFTFLLAIGCYLWLLHWPGHLILSTYLSLFVALLSVLYFESVLPNRKEWQASRGEKHQDLFFITLVHLLLTKLLGFSVAMLLYSVFDAQPISSRLWPSHWPILLQGILMVLCVDFIRYWLHRASHKYKYLWRLHAVHHSPKRLYWLNVGRFHPVERTLQFLLDSLPFMLMGVSKEVLALYFLFFAVNGFFQHCNIRLNYGFLNYVFSSAELHRWHHSKIPSESNTNFSNTTIIWDMVFGTRFLPKHRVVGELGLTNDQYPQDFVSQMKTPFIAGIENQNFPLISWRDVCLNFLLAVKMTVLRATLYHSLAKAAQNPEKTQKQVLRKILGKNRDTVFGKTHGFYEIQSHKAYLEKVPVQNYEDLRPYIEEQEKTEKAMLTEESPILYHQTSGTTGLPKYIPLVGTALTRLYALQKIFACIEYRFCPEGFQGKLLGVVSPAIEGQLPSGLPFGSASGLTYRNMPMLARAKYVVPYEVFEIQDSEIKYYLIVRLALAEKNITHMGSANPSTFFKMLEIISQRSTELVEDVRSGQAKYLDRLEPRFTAAIAARIRPQPARAAELQKILQAPLGADFSLLWPYLKLVTSWTGGSCGMAIAKLKSKLPPDARVFELGYLSSEFRGTLTVDGNTGEGVPTLQDHFFEFVERNAWESGERHFLGLEEIKQNQEYYVFITTFSGLYRYAMNDIVQVVGQFKRTPTLRFLQKGKGVTNITGEKLYESQVIAAIKAIESEMGLHIHFFQMLADEENFRYLLYLECELIQPADAMESALDKLLQATNLEYKAKRSSNRLKPLEIRSLQSGAFEAYKRHFLAKGQRELQFKPMPLLYAKNLEFDLESWRSKN